ncbi:hypothetical protein JF770_14975 [Mycobacterium intracellulare]|uniref:hypothetical protein n=1 Tax=Mycobacterium intracellulare TaxID=1767 RepID=UPI001CD9AEAA|nr:hypothetical protein [Mycobacterium intracellulare]MCA2304868.1 hypothetical protein [Mycobacterium intracellulare]MCA2347101.1 hypothetical protein [Mycobacterium intracellulare]
MHIIAKHVAATLRSRGYAARAYRTPHGPYDRPESGVVIHIVRTEAWRYPNGRWEIIDCPARLVQADADSPHTWMWNDDLAVPELGSSSALAAWVAERLPPPDQPEYHTYWHFSSPGTRSAAPPQQWEKCWREHLFTRVPPALAPGFHLPARLHLRRNNRSMHSKSPRGEHL